MSEQTYIYRAWTDLLDCNNQIRVDKVKGGK